MATCFIITHPEMGIYLGHCLGMGFWTMLDPVGQPSATTFPDANTAQQHVRSWAENNDPAAYSFVPVLPDDAGHAGIQALKDAGLAHLLGDMEADMLRYAEPAGNA